VKPGATEGYFISVKVEAAVAEGELLLLIDGEIVGSTPLLEGWNDYEFKVPVPAGFHEVAVGAQHAFSFPGQRVYVRNTFTVENIHDPRVMGEEIEWLRFINENEFFAHSAASTNLILRELPKFREAFGTRPIDLIVAEFGGAWVEMGEPTTHAAAFGTIAGAAVLAEQLKIYIEEDFPMTASWQFLTSYWRASVESVRKWLPYKIQGLLRPKVEKGSGPGCTVRDPEPLPCRHGGLLCRQTENHRRR